MQLTFKSGTSSTDYGCTEDILWHNHEGMLQTSEENMIWLVKKC